MRTGRVATVGGLTLLLVAACVSSDEQPLSQPSPSEATVPSQPPTLDPAPLTAEQRERYSIVPTVEPDPSWCGPINSAVVYAYQGFPAEVAGSPQEYVRDSLALSLLPGLPDQLREYLAERRPAFDTGLQFVWSPYDLFGRDHCPATEAYKLARASGPKVRLGGQGYVPYGIPSASPSN